MVDRCTTIDSISVGPSRDHKVDPRVKKTGTHAKGENGKKKKEQIEARDESEAAGEGCDIE